MDNDNKVGMKPEVRLFLQNALFNADKENADTYNLEREYANAKKNRNHKITFLLIGLVLVAGIATVGVTQYIEYRNRQITVNVDVFEDINLKKLLDMVSRTESELAEAVSEKSRNEQDRLAELQAAEARNEVDKLALQSLGLASVQLQQRMTELDEEYNEQITEINSRYEGLLLDINTRITEYQNQLAAYDSNSVEAAQEQQAAIDSQRQVFEMEKQKLIEKYEAELSELRNRIMLLQEQDIQSQKDYVKESNDRNQYQISLYDPVINDQYGDEIIRNTAASWTDRYEIDGAGPESQLYPSLVDTATRMDKLEYIFQVLRQLPQINSVPRYVKAMKELALETATVLSQEAGQIVTELNDEVAGLNDEIDGLNGQIAGLNDDIDGLQAQNGVLAGEKAAAYERIGELDDQVESLSEQIRQLQAQVGQLQSQVAGLNGTVSSRDDVIAAMEDALAAEKADNAILRSATGYFDRIAFDSGKDGLIIARDGARFLVYVSPAYAGKADGLTAWVYRGTTEYIGEVRLSMAGSYLYAEPVSTAAGKTIKVSDQLILKNK